MKDNAPPLSSLRFKWAWKCFKSYRAEARGDFSRAIALLDEAARIKAPSASDRVQRALLLLKGQHIREAHEAFGALRQEFKDSANPDHMYLRRYCTYILSTLSRVSGQWAHEAKEAQSIKCRPSLKYRFRMVTVDEIDNAIRPRS